MFDLPWTVPLAEWPRDRLVQVVRGISRHVVRFIYEGGILYALKELPVEAAQREYRLLRQLAARDLRVVEAVGVVTDRTHTGRARKTAPGITGVRPTTKTSTGSPSPESVCGINP